MSKDREFWQAHSQFSGSVRTEPKGPITQPITTVPRPFHVKKSDFWGEREEGVLDFGCWREKWWHGRERGSTTASRSCLVRFSTIKRQAFFGKKSIWVNYPIASSSPPYHHRSRSIHVSITSASDVDVEQAWTAVITAPSHSPSPLLRVHPMSKFDLTWIGGKVVA